MMARGGLAEELQRGYRVTIAGPSNFLALLNIGVGLAFLSTVRMDGAPRVHPVQGDLFVTVRELIGLLAQR